MYVSTWLRRHRSLLIWWVAHYINDCPHSLRVYSPQNWGAPQTENPRECPSTHCAYLIHLGRQSLPNALRMGHLVSHPSLIWATVGNVFTFTLTVMTADLQRPILHGCEHLEVSPRKHNFHCAHQSLPERILRSLSKNAFHYIDSTAVSFGVDYTQTSKPLGHSKGCS